jgi:hypothetical protein
LRVVEAIINRQQTIVNIICDSMLKTCREYFQGPADEASDPTHPNQQHPVIRQLSYTIDGVASVLDAMVRDLREAREMTDNILNRLLPPPS